MLRFPNPTSSTHHVSSFETSKDLFCSIIERLFQYSCSTEMSFTAISCGLMIIFSSNINILEQNPQEMAYGESDGEFSLVALLKIVLKNELVELSTALSVVTIIFSGVILNGG
jgi:hypothetical protein